MNENVHKHIYLKYSDHYHSFTTTLNRVFNKQKKTPKLSDMIFSRMGVTPDRLLNSPQNTRQTICFVFSQPPGPGTLGRAADSQLYLTALLLRLSPVLPCCVLSYNRQYSQQ